MPRGDGGRAMEPVISRAQTRSGGLTRGICQNLLQNIERDKISTDRERDIWMNDMDPGLSPLSALALTSQLSSNWTFNLQYLLAPSVTLASPFWADSEIDWFSGLIVTVIRITKPQMARVQNYNKKSYSNPDSLSNKLYFYWIFSIENSSLSDQINSLSEASLPKSVPIITLLYISRTLQTTSLHFQNMRL